MTSASLDASDIPSPVIVSNTSNPPSLALSISSTCLIEQHFGKSWNVTSEKIIRPIRAFYQHTLAQVCVYGELTDSFEIRTGFRQGCVLSLTIFNYAIDWVMNTACRHSRGVQISPENSIIDLEYADDVVLLADRYDEMHTILNNASSTVGENGLRIIINKTIVFSSFYIEADKIPIFINSLSAEEALDFKYFGYTPIPNSHAKDETITRISTVIFPVDETTMEPSRNHHEEENPRPYDCETWSIRVEDIKNR
ncbi:unnamed protein product [Dracunculus medinensis]|uniref:Reverse transcriptase domain-containing protein n=1 Tax=Dracunculus medinensis TaxID=318479 RepID=A0A0N4UQX7_DRAME|nr:unnamed protein product [Dracunculus medinensis]